MYIFYETNKIKRTINECSTGLQDALAATILDAYRYRVSQKKKLAIGAEIKRRVELADGEGEKDFKERQKRIKNMYLVNKLKFFSIATAEELRKDLSTERMDEDTHRILQHRVR
jgi:hypothetical protein